MCVATPLQLKVFVIRKEFVRAFMKTSHHFMANPCGWFCREPGQQATSQSSGFKLDKQEQQQGPQHTLLEATRD